MGAGKTLVGALVAQRAQAAFFDLDHLVEDKAGMSVAEIFATHSEKAFRAFEKETLPGLLRPDAVVALGGGVVMDDDNRLILDSSSGGYPVLIGTNLNRELRNVITRLDPTGAAIITDTNVRPYAARVAKAIKRAGLKTSIHAIPASERSKSMSQLEAVLSFLERQRIDRGGCVIAVGGGTVGDLAGLAAAMWQRGVRLVAVPTTLLAMVDSSIGGKTGVNGRRSKNAIGAFWQPAAVISDLATIETRPVPSYRDAFAEVTSATGDRGPSSTTVTPPGTR